ncbi:MAG TPA: DMT family transporter [Bacteroidota bacterium]|jgi:drug/metabolite transporter (DMT)-like permease|nr:DMT family transporter [Bacteroidota bacterium]
MKGEKGLVALGLITISLIWGSTWLVIKIGLDSVPPLFAVALRFTLALIILAVIMAVRGERLPRDRSAITSYLILTFLSFSFPFALVYWGEQYISSGLASILFAMYPLIVAVESHFLLSAEKLHPFKTVGILMGFIGVVVIFWSDIQIGTMNTAGMIAILVSTLLQGTSLVLIKKRATHISPLSLSLGGMIGAVIVLFILAFALERVSDVHLDARGIGSIIYLGSLGTVVTFLTYYWLLKRVEAVYLSLVTLVTPVLAVILGAIVLDERLESRVFTGATLILLGILVANGRDIAAAVSRRNTQIKEM